MFYEDDVEENHNLPLSHARVIVYYWAGASSIRKINHLSFVTGPSFGHVALAIIPDLSNPEQQTYISFWPGACQAHNHHRVDDGYVCRQHTSHFHTKNDDDYIYQNRLPETIVLDSLDTQAMITSYQAFLQSQYTWSVIGSSFLASETKRNCVGLSLALLYAGRVKPLLDEYYHLGFLSGTLISPTTLMWVEYVKYIIKFITLFTIYLFQPGSGLANSKEFKRLMLIDTVATIMGALIGSVFTLLIPSPSVYVIKNKRALLTPLIGTTVGVALSAVIFYIENMHNEGLEHKYFNSESSPSILSKYGHFLFFIIQLLPFFISYIAEKIISKKYVYRPGFISGLISPIISSILTEPFKVILPKIYDRDLKFQSFIFYFFLSIVSSIFISYITRAVSNYLINDMVKTPRDLLRLLKHARNIESLKNNIELEDIESTTIVESNNAFFSYKYVFPVATVAVSVIGFFALKNRDKIPSIAGYIGSTLARCIGR